MIILIEKILMKKIKYKIIWEKYKKSFNFAAKNFHFLKYKETPFLKKYQSFLRLQLESSISRNIINFIRVGFVLFFKLRKFPPEVFQFGTKFSYKVFLRKNKKCFHSGFFFYFFCFSSLGLRNYGSDWIVNRMRLGKITFFSSTRIRKSFPDTFCGSSE